MSKKAIRLAVVAASIVVVFGASTWWTGTKVRAAVDNALGEFPVESDLVRVVERTYERGFFSAVSNVTLELGCEVGTASNGPSDFKPIRVTWRDTIHHGPFAGGGFAAATIDSELVLDARAQAEATRLFGTAKPLTAHTRFGFDGGYISDITVAPAKLTEAGKGSFAWQGAQARVETNAARDQVHYVLTMPGMDLTGSAQDLQLKVGKLTAKGDLDARAGGWWLVTGKTDAQLESFEFTAPKGLGGNAAPPVPKLLLQGIGLASDATIQDGLYGATATLKGTGKLGETPIEGFTIASNLKRIQVAGYDKVMAAWMQSDAGRRRCGKGHDSSPPLLPALVDRFAPDLKAMAKYDPEIGIDKMVVEIGGKRGELSYSAGLVGVTDSDLKGPGTALLMTRGVVKASARLPKKWLEQLADAGASTGQTPPPDMVAGLIAQGEKKGFVQSDGDDITARLDFSDGTLKINGKPLDALGK